MLDNDSIEDFYLLSRLKGRRWLLPFAKLAQKTGYELTVEDDRIADPMIRVTDLETKKYLELPFDGTEEEDIERLITDFPNVYATLTPIDEPWYAGDDDAGVPEESCARRIVDVLLEGDVDDFVGDFSRGQEIEGGKPLSPVPDDKDVVRAVRFQTGHALYMWETYRRSKYGQPVLGYRFMAPNSTILFQGEDYSPGALHDPIGNESIAGLMGYLTQRPGDTDEEYFSKYTPAQLEWAESSECEQLSGDLSGDPGMLESFPWEDLPGYEYGQEEA